LKKIPNHWFTNLKELANDPLIAEILKQLKEVMNRESGGTACKFVTLALD